MFHRGLFEAFEVMLFHINMYMYTIQLMLILLFQVAIFLIQRNRHALIGRAIDDHEMEKVLEFLKSDPVNILQTTIVSLHAQPMKLL